MPKARDKTNLRRAVLVAIHKDLQDFVIKSAEKAGCKNESEYVNAVLRRLKAGVER